MQGGDMLSKIRTNKFGLIQIMTSFFENLHGKELERIAKKVLKGHNSIKVDSLKYVGEDNEDSSYSEQKFSFKEKT